MDAEMAADGSEGQRRENDQGFNYTSCLDIKGSEDTISP